MMKRAKTRKTFDAIDTYARYLNERNQQMGISTKAAINMYRPFMLHSSYWVSKQMTWSICWPMNIR